MAKASRQHPIMTIPALFLKHKEGGTEIKKMPNIKATKSRTGLKLKKELRKIPPVNARQMNKNCLDGVILS